ncbi:MAG: mannose-6-phosphate isomerase [Lachnospiraceae bacterium]|nr:mannose-6-phosphate isomerase [Lachnospiraceae bacterium]
MTQKEILFFTPDNKTYIWGSERWTISAHSHGDVKVNGGRFDGMALSQLYKEHPELFGKEKGDSQAFPLLVKIISANDDLSIQVHPDNEYASLNENGSLGKTECWYILDCDKDAELVLGHNAKDINELNEMVSNNRFSSLIKSVAVKKGDFIQINPGTVHAIKGGITLLEIQQSSDITYRLYDYDRLDNGKPRPLHLKQAIDVIHCPAPPLSDSMITKRTISENQMNRLISCDFYTIREMKVVKEARIEQVHNFMIVCVVNGSGFVGDKEIKAGSHFIIPCGFGEVIFIGDMEVVLAVS